MEELPPKEQPRDTLPGYEVVLHVGRSQVVATVFVVGYTRGRRRTLSRKSWPIGPADAPESDYWPAALAEYLTQLISRLRDA